MTPYYSHAGIEIYHGDCREILPGLPKGPASSGWKQWQSSGWDSAGPDDALLLACRSKAKRAVIWGGNYFNLPPSMGWLIWNKMQREFSLADGEMAWTSERRATRIFDHSRAAALLDGRQHPTQKPIALMKWCISLFPGTKTVLDPFMGSGTTLVAAKDLGMQAIGIEREEPYCEIAAKRLSQEVFEFPAQSLMPQQEAFA